MINGALRAVGEIKIMPKSNETSPQGEIATYHQSINDTEYEEWFNEKMRVAIARGTFTKKTPPNITIDDNGYRHVFCVVNSRDVRLYFDTSQDALKACRESENQPCKIIEHPIMPMGCCWYDDIHTLAKKIENELYQ